MAIKFQTFRLLLPTNDGFIRLDAQVHRFYVREGLAKNRFHFVSGITLNKAPESADNLELLNIPTVTSASVKLGKVKFLNSLFDNPLTR